MRLDAVDEAKRTLRISGHDFVDGTPVLDVKPYLLLDSFSHSTVRVPEAFTGKDGAGGFLRQSVSFVEGAEDALRSLAPGTRFYSGGTEG